MPVLPRTRQPELMDDPALDEAAHRHALRGLARLNAASFAADTLWRGLRRLMPDATRIRLLDVATGSGDIPLAVRERAEREGVRLDLTLCDISEQALATAHERADRTGSPVETVAADALSEVLPAGFDVASCSLFLHHIDADDVVTLLARLGRSADHILVSDLERSHRGVALAAAASRVMTRSPIVHTDAVLSARAAWTLDEVLGFAESAGLTGATGRRVFPCRFLMQWSRP